MIRNLPNITWQWPTEFLQEDACLFFGKSNDNHKNMLINRLALKEVVERLQKYHEAYGDLPDGL